MEHKNTTTKRIATELRVARERSTRGRLTNADIAEAAGISPMAAGRYMNGEREIPLTTFMRICSVLGVSPGVILDEAGK